MSYGTCACDKPATRQVVVEGVAVLGIYCRACYAQNRQSHWARLNRIHRDNVAWCKKMAADFDPERATD
jgi:hypothetical protein